MARLRWYPPAGDLVEVGAWPVKAVEVEGLGPPEHTLQVEDLPGEGGQWPVAVVVPARVVRARCIVASDDRYGLRRTLGDAFTADQTPPGQTPTLGTLRADPGDGTWWQARAVGKLHYVGRQYAADHVDLEWVCPDPWWQELTPREVTLRLEPGGAQWPVTFPLAIVDSRPSADAANPSVLGTVGDVTFHGPLTSPSLTHPGGSLSIDGQVGDSEQLTVTGSPADLTATLVDGDGVESDAMHRVVWETSAPVTVPGGGGTLTLDATAGTGRAVIRWTVRVGGL